MPWTRDSLKFSSMRPSHAVLDNTCCPAKLWVQLCPDAKIVPGRSTCLNCYHAVFHQSVYLTEVLALPSKCFVRCAKQPLCVVDFVLDTHLCIAVLPFRITFGRIQGGRGLCHTHTNISACESAQLHHSSRRRELNSWVNCTVTANKSGVSPMSTKTSALSNTFAQFSTMSLRVLLHRSYSPSWRTRRVVGTPSSTEQQKLQIRIRGALSYSK